VLRALDPSWLREQYEDNHRSFVEIAADLDIPPSDLARHARKLGLAIRHGVSAHKHILASHGGVEAFSAAIWATFAARGAEQRVQRFLAIPGHTDLNQAAKHLGIRKAVLVQQVEQLEHVVDAKLLETTRDSSVIRLTPAGEKFVQEVLPVLAMLA
jgi:DNA-binding MarR family transcriptional regulator